MWYTGYHISDWDSSSCSEGVNSLLISSPRDSDSDQRDGGRGDGAHRCGKAGELIRFLGECR